MHGVFLLPTGFLIYFKLLERRRKEATEEEIERYKAVLKVDNMSEDEDVRSRWGRVASS